MDKQIAAIKSVDGVKSVNLHKSSGRIYINLKGNGGNYRGEQTSKVYISTEGEFVIERGKGSVSREWNAQVDAAKAAFEAASQPTPDTLCDVLGESYRAAGDKAEKDFEGMVLTMGLEAATEKREGDLLAEIFGSGYTV